MMETLGGLTRTGNKVSGPASDLVELENERGLKHVGITFHRKYRDHAALNADLHAVMAFLEQPDVCDVLDLVQRVPESGAFIYATGTVVSVAEILETLARMGEPGGVRAGLELCYLTAQLLQDGVIKGEKHGVFSHGDVSPWRVLCKPDGQVQLIGFGIPQVDVIAFQDDDRAVPKEDGFRYCPPERIEGEHEDLTSDVFSLALVAFELMVGESLYNGVLSEIRQQATNAQGPYRLYQYRERLPEAVIDLLTRCLKYDMDTRHSDVNEFIWEVKDLLSLPEIDGPTLAEVVQKVRNRLRRNQPAGDTAAMTREELAAIAEELDAPRKGKLPEPKGARPGTEPEPEDGQRWGRVSRSGARDGRRGAAAPEPPTDKSRLRDRLRRSGSRPPPAEPVEKDARASLKDRLRRSRDEAPPSARRDAPSSSGGRSGSGRRDAERDTSRPGRSDRDVGRSSQDVGRSSQDDGGGKARASSLLSRLRSSKDGSATASPSGAEESAPTWRVRLDGGAVASVTLAGDRSAVELAWHALQEQGGPTMALTGTVLTWAALAADGDEVQPDTVLSDLPDGAGLRLIHHPVRVVMATVEVEGVPDLTLRSPVSTGVTAGAMLDEVLRLLELDGQGWQIAVDGRGLHRLTPLGQVVDNNDVTVVVSK